MIVEGVVEGRLGQRLKGVIPLTNLNLVTQLTKMLDALLGPDELEDSNELESLFLQASSSSSSSIAAAAATAVVLVTDSSLTVVMGVYTALVLEHVFYHITKDEVELV